jgi:hypothetical protein
MLRKACLILLPVFLFFYAFRPDKKERTDLQKKADRFMWDNFHQGNYDSIDVILDTLYQAYQKDSTDVRITSHLAFINLWKFCERGRKAPDTSVFRSVTQSKLYFKKAIALNPADPRLKGFLAAAEICEGAIDKKLGAVLKGYVRGNISIMEWPIFNKFALSIIESQRDSGSLMFKQGLKYQWDVIDKCSCEDLSQEKVMRSPHRTFKNLIRELQHSDDTLIRRACWNTWIAPHNMEGFLLNFGDMLVKAGRTEEAIVMYKATRAAPSYEDWPFRDLIATRIKEAEQNVMEFNKPLRLLYNPGEKQIFVNSELVCMGCHQMGQKEFLNYGYQEPGDEIYFLTRLKTSEVR